METAPVRGAAPSERQRARTWRWTAATGVSLLALVTIHMVAHHFIVEGIGGLRTYEQVLDYIASPVIFVIESILLIVITIHAMLGLRSVLFDFGLSTATRSLVNKGLLVLGAATVAYGLVLIGVLASKA